MDNIIFSFICFLVGILVGFVTAIILLAKISFKFLQEREL